MIYMMQINLQQVMIVSSRIYGPRVICKDMILKFLFLNELEQYLKA